MNRLSLGLKIIFTVTVLFFAVFSLLNFQHMKLSKEYYLETEKEKLAIILQTLLPVLSVSVELEFASSVADQLNKIHQDNRQLLASRVLSYKNEVLFEYAVDEASRAELSNPAASTIYLRQKIYSPSKLEPSEIGFIEAIYSTSHYKSLVDEYTQMYFRISALFALLTIGVSIWLFFILRPLGKVAKELESFDPQKMHRLASRDGSYELNIITNAANSMMDRIQKYTDELSQNLEENRKRDELMFKQARAAQMGEMISIIAHQWRQPLSSIGAIASNIKMLLDLGKAEPVRLIRLVERIDEHLEYLSTTVNDFRNIFNPRKKSEDARLDDVCKRAYSLMRSDFIAQHIAFHSFYEYQSNIKTYPNELLQVVLTILKNSFDALAERRPLVPMISIRGYEDKSHQYIEISDNAGGIGEAAIEKLFDLYFSTKDEKNGTGLGLYMARLIVEKNCKGEITARNENGGAVFEIKLPKGGLDD